MKQDTPNRDEALLEAIAKAGGPAALAAALNLTTSAVSQWRRAPHFHARKIAALTGVSAKRLRPDLFAPMPKTSEAVE
jgi:DNA-binding transcriptional regulator YdaS (Cro superfamily)